MKISICCDRGSHGPLAEYSYWSAYRENGRKIDFGGPTDTEVNIRKTIRKFYPDAAVEVIPSHLHD